MTKYLDKLEVALRALKIKIVNLVISPRKNKQSVFSNFSNTDGKNMDKLAI